MRRGGRFQRGARALLVNQVHRTKLGCLQRNSHPSVPSVSQYNWASLRFARGATWQSARCYVRLAGRTNEPSFFVPQAVAIIVV